MEIFHNIVFAVKRKSCRSQNFWMVVYIEQYFLLANI